MAGEKKYIALEATSQEIRAICGNTYIRIGETPNETGGSATEGTVFAKLNKLIEQLTTVVSSIGTDSSITTKKHCIKKLIIWTTTLLGYNLHICSIPASIYLEHMMAEQKILRLLLHHHAPAKSPLRQRSPEKAHQAPSRRSSLRQTEQPY